MKTANLPVSKLSSNQKLPIKTVAKALASPVRWRILAELVNGQPDMVLGLAKKLQLPAVTISQHIGVLRRAGVVVVGLGRLYTIAPQFLADHAQGYVDFGCCVLRLKDDAETPAA